MSRIIEHLAWRGGRIFLGADVSGVDHYAELFDRYHLRRYQVDQAIETGYQIGVLDVIDRGGFAVVRLLSTDIDAALSPISHRMNGGRI